MGERELVALPAQQARLHRFRGGGGQCCGRLAQQARHVPDRERAPGPPTVLQEPPDRRRHAGQQSVDRRTDAHGHALGQHRGRTVQDDDLSGLHERTQDVLQQPRVAPAAVRPAEHRRIGLGAEDAGAQLDHRLVVQRPHMEPDSAVADQPVEGVLGERRRGHRPAGQQPEHRGRGEGADELAQGQSADVVDTVGVVQHDHQRVPARRVLDQLTDPVHEPERIAVRTRQFVEPVRAGQGPPQEVDQQVHGGGRLVGAARTSHDRRQTALGRLHGRGLQQLGLAHPEGAFHDDAVPRSPRRGVQVGAQDRQDPLTPRQWIHDSPRVALQSRPSSFPSGATRCATVRSGRLHTCRPPVIESSDQRGRFSYTGRPRRSGNSRSHSHYSPG